MIRRSVTIPAPVEQVWEALTDPARLSSWFGGRMDWRAVEGAPLSFRGDDGEQREGRVEEVRPGRHLRFVWWPVGGGTTEGSSPAEGTWADEGASEVSYLLEPSEESTRLTVQEKAVASSGPEVLAAMPRGWDAWDDRLAGAWAGLSFHQQMRARA